MTPDPDFRARSFDEIAAAMYPELAGPAPADPSPPSPDASAADHRPAGDGEEAGAIPPERTRDAIAEELYADGGQLHDAPAGYTPTLSSTFDPLLYQARYDHNDEAVAALTDGQRVAGELLHELRVPTHEAQQLSSDLGRWHAREPLDDDEIEQRGHDAMEALHKAWGSNFEANLAHARSAAARAMEKAPWLRDLMEKGAGNDAELIKQFAAIGKRQAKRASK